MRKIVMYAIICFQILLIISLIKGIQTSKKSSARITGMQEVRDKLLSEQNKLKEEVEYVKSQFYLEKVARDELHLSREGETVVIIPEGQKIGDVSSLPAQKKPDEVNWQKWMSVLFGKE